MAVEGPTSVAPSSQSTAPTTASFVGIIYPPPELRIVVDKTAQFVARNGADFENKIRANDTVGKFKFIDPTDPYHAYYAHKVAEAREGKSSDAKDASEGEAKARGVSDVQPTAPVPAAVVAQEQAPADAAPMTRAERAKAKEIVVKNPPPEFQFVADAPSITSIDLDIIKLTAQFVASRGRAFLTQLMAREQRNYQFDFLRPQHSHFQYFTRLVEQFSKVINPSTEMREARTRLYEYTAGSGPRQVSRCLATARGDGAQETTGSQRGRKACLCIDRLARLCHRGEG
eukprot:Opistho-2@86475